MWHATLLLRTDKIILQALLLMQEIRIVSAWKPVQSGIKLATSSILSLHHQLVVDGELKFFLYVRFRQDALENIFSQVRAKGVLHPKPVQFRFSLPLVCLAQFMALPLSGSYDVDDTPHLISFLKSSKDDYPENDESFSMQDDDDQAALCLLSIAAALPSDICESKCFYYAAGWANHIKLQKINCSACSNCFLSRIPEVHLQGFSVLTSMKPYQPEFGMTKTTNYLCHPSSASFISLRKAEVFLKEYQSYLLHSSCPEEIILNKIVYDPSEFPVCHSVVPAILKRYVKLRLGHSLLTWPEKSENVTHHFRFWWNFGRL